MTDPVLAHVATIARREAQLRDMVASLAPQVDVLQIYANDYSTSPIWSSDYDNLVWFFGPLRFEGDLGDAGKFFSHDIAPAYHIAVDDDLSYPPDLVETLLIGIERYGRRATVSLHGNVLKRIDRPFTSYYRDARSKSLPVLARVNIDHPCHCPGTNSFAYHTDTIRFHLKHFRRYWNVTTGQGRNMADIWAGIRLKEQGVPCVVLAHDRNYVRHLPMDLSDNIYNRYFQHDIDQTRAVNEYGPWPALKLPQLEFATS